MNDGTEEDISLSDEELERMADAIGRRMDGRPYDRDEILWLKRAANRLPIRRGSIDDYYGAGMRVGRYIVFKFQMDDYEFDYGEVERYTDQSYLLCIDSDTLKRVSILYSDEVQDA